MSERWGNVSVKALRNRGRYRGIVLLNRCMCVLIFRFFDDRKQAAIAIFHHIMKMGKFNCTKVQETHNIRKTQSKFKQGPDLAAACVFLAWFRSLVTQKVTSE